MFGDDFENDYKYDANLDHYDTAELDEEKYDIIGDDQREAAEKAMRKRDKELKARIGNSTSQTCMITQVIPS